ncbi:heterokaryon incompatibility protein-domain-containing protein [Schizothecium vesticola]|uniref:Heterokaryon incompatibility protein-domain-containing protein n=1 Tax=Schizothecium vesticola TaxID=314040 RepID=A0AA40F9P3_9PEZI|nr:heterokaryon incompatibility protein-domain-containing protein [Schizothecium vesticola]
MWLINVHTLELEYFMGQNTPPYAILSHTWEDEEVTYQDMRQLTPDTGTRNKQGFAKIRETCRLAASDGLRYAWVDTCCIDKSSSAELTEAINSMYRWYEDAAVCYAYLSDFDDSADETALAASRWFTRGWTLQELIAPENVTFWSRNWVKLGDKWDLNDCLHTITNIPARLLRGTSIVSDYSIACRMSWAARRETTRVEDTAYCLLGLFNINMSLLYGEGSNAFYRL